MILPRLIPSSRAKYFIFLWATGLHLIPFAITAQIQGKVYRDFNTNGVFDSTATFKEIGLSGITVTAYNAANTSVGTTTTNSTGNYTIPSVSGALRIEFSGMETTDFSTFKGLGNGSNIQFVTAPATGISLGLNYPAHYCQTDPLMATNCYINGNNSTGTSGSSDVLVKFQASYSGSSSAPTHIGIASEMGTTWGLAYQKETNKLFSAAYLKRHTGFGPLGSGGIYSTNMATGTTSSFVNLNGLAGISTGANPHTGLVGDKTQPSKDSTTFHQIGKLGLGDLDISDDGKYLFVVNLFSREIHKIFINNPATVPTAADITTYTIPNPCGNSDYRPFALKYYKGKLYVGVVCTAEASQTRTALAAHVYEMIPETGVFSASPILSTSLDFTRGKAWRPQTSSNKWYPWTNTWTSITISAEGTMSYPQPILSDIEFDVEESMILGFRDRLGDQLGVYNQYPNGTSYAAEVVTGGDIMRAAKSGATWVMESNGVVGSLSSGAANGEGIGGSEFYKGDFFYGNETSWGHQEISNGGLALLAGSGEVAMTAVDALAESVGFSGYNSGGIRYLNNTNGAFADGYLVYDTDSSPGTFQKSNGLGDVEFLCSAAPLEIGNRVWTDTNSDGKQDADEAGIDDVTVLLFEGAVQVGTTISANGGQYYFNAGNVIGGLKNNTTYEIRIATTQSPLSTLSLTTTDVSNNGIDIIDNDGTGSGANALKVFTTGSAGENNHSYDFGFSPMPIDLVLTKNVDSSSVSIAGRQVTFTLNVKNVSVTNATGVTVKVTSSAGFTFVSATPSVSYVAGTGIWTVGAVNAGDSTTLVLTVKADSVGVNYCTAEINSADQTDSNSTPNNSVTTEDDIARACVSVPILLCPTQVYTAALPSGLTDIKWFKNGIEIAGQTGSSLAISEIGDYTFTASEVTCPVEGCCSIRVVTGTCTVPCKSMICLPVVVVRQ